MSEYSISKSKPPRYNGKGGRDFIVFSIHFKAWLHTQGKGAVLDANFESQLPATGNKRETLKITATGSSDTAEAAKKEIECVESKFESCSWFNSCIADR